MAIKHGALMSIEDRERRAFGRHTDLSDRYVPGERWDPTEETEGLAIHCMVIGEAPGATEDVKRRPFVGRAGVLLRRLMSDISMPPTWITNVVKFRPMGNRTPTGEEIESARPYLRAEWEAIDRPRVIICLGNTALKAVTGNGGILKRAGTEEHWQASDGHTICVFPMLHPSYAQRHPEIIPTVEKHWRALGKWLDASYS